MKYNSKYQCTGRREQIDLTFVSSIFKCLKAGYFFFFNVYPKSSYKKPKEVMLRFCQHVHRYAETHLEKKIRKNGFHPSEQFEKLELIQKWKYVQLLLGLLLGENCLNFFKPLMPPCFSCSPVLLRPLAVNESKLET